LNFIENGGTAVTNISGNFGDSITQPANPTRTGYTFAGWFSNENLTTAFTFPATFPDYGVDGTTVNIYAKWTANTYTVSFSPEAGTVDETIATYDSPMPLTGTNNVDYSGENPVIIAPPIQNVTIQVPVQTGYIFNGYFFGATQYYTNTVASARSWDRTSNTTLTASFTAITYTIQYNGNEATTGSTASSSHTYDVAKALTTNGFSRTGHFFVGWNTLANGTGTSYTNSQSVINLSSTQGATVTLYAQWQVENYCYIFNTNGGSAISDLCLNYGDPVTPPLNPTRTGYTFAG
jgi:uncharacterized repeat protein (TIGR02543 family)